MKSDKPEISLLISDVDNTLLDFFETWGKSTTKAFARLAESRGISVDRLKKNVKENTTAESRMHDLVRMISETPCLQPATEEDRRRFAKTDAKIIHDWKKARESNPLYEGVVATVRKMKKAGTKFVLYSDSPGPSLVNRLAHRDFPAELIDGIYVQPELGSDGKPVNGGKPLSPMQVKGKDREFRKKLGDKIIWLEKGTRKPRPENFDRIMADMGVSDKSRVAMVGDSVRSDVSGAKKAGIVSVWQKQGAAELSDETVDFMSAFAKNPNFIMGLKRMEKAMKEDPAYRADITLEKGFKDLSAKVTFVSAKKGKGTAQQALYAALVQKEGR